METKISFSTARKKYKILEVYLIRNVKACMRKKIIKTLLKNRYGLEEMEDIFGRYFMKRKTIS